MSTLKIQAPVPEFNSRWDKDPARKEKFDQLFDEEMMEQTLDGDQVHDMYVRYMMGRLQSCQYGEFNGHSIIGLDRIKHAFEVDLRALNLSSEYEGVDIIKARSKTGDSYLFHVAPVTFETALARLLRKAINHV